MEQVAV